MRPSSWNGVGAIAKVPAAWWVSFVIWCLCSLWSFRGTRSVNPESRDSGFDAAHRPGMTFPLKPPCAHLDLFLGEENLLGVFDDILRLPALMRWLPARLFHHPHLAHAARAGDAEDLAGLVARQIADHV